MQLTFDVPGYGPIRINTKSREVFFERNQHYTMMNENGVFTDEWDGTWYFDRNDTEATLDLLVPKQMAMVTLP